MGNSDHGTACMRVGANGNPKHVRQEREELMQRVKDNLRGTPVMSVGIFPRVTSVRTASGRARLGRGHKSFM